MSRERGARHVGGVVRGSRCLHTTAVGSLWTKHIFVPCLGAVWGQCAISATVSDDFFFELIRLGDRRSGLG